MFNDLHRNVGLGLRERERRQKAEYQMRGTGLAGGFKPGLAWDALFGGMREAGVDRLADQSVRERRGMFPDQNRMQAEEIQPIDPRWTAVNDAEQLLPSSIRALIGRKRK